MTDLNEQAFKAAKNAFHATYATPDGPLRGAIAAYVAALPTPSPSTHVTFSNTENLEKLFTNTSRESFSDFLSRLSTLWNFAIEACAALIEKNIIMDTSAGKVLAPRQDGNRDGLHYAAAIRALATTEGQTDA